ncbi:hypothetical protein A3A39_00555 [Candidatus Kaiserbacteria bacterium RIFCSPLOWO2_01_FULL_54_13]|uniref:Uncharacterized protein n=1 Tax=Candidatus Kaiserbacteria bacterium RIFCSPLOWO2_01_FULL_54_13 TaxID=1798512 RepID=A0A1F6F0J3_9BACT|nr:MAG: hypothetical protein A3A39_00555 [Candidatus Kaiserbacteria bacterium RIFCSPLOWO2_01_FULL_54_13]
MSRGKSRFAGRRVRKLTAAMCAHHCGGSKPHLNEPTHASSADIAMFRSVKVVAENGVVKAEGISPDAVLAAFDAARGLTGK